MNPKEDSHSSETINKEKKRDNEKQKMENKDSDNTSQIKRVIQNKIQENDNTRKESEEVEMETAQIVIYKKRVLNQESPSDEPRGKKRTQQKREANSQDTNEDIGEESDKEEEEEEVEEEESIFQSEDEEEKNEEDTEVTKDTEGFQLGSAEQKRKRAQEMKEKRYITKIQETFVSTMLGKSTQNKQEDTYVIIKIENTEKTKVVIQKSSKSLIQNVINSQVPTGDIVEIRINTKMNNATVSLNIGNKATQKTKEFVAKLRKQSETLNMADQVCWGVTLIQSSSIGVIRNVPEGENVKDILDWCHVNDRRVITVRKIGKYALSIKFNCSLPEYIHMPFGESSNYEVETYVPGTKRCAKCYRYGHSANTCTGLLTCAYCGGTGHKAANCRKEREPKCPNCDGKHGPLSWECPITKKKKTKRNEELKSKREGKKDSVFKALGLNTIFDTATQNPSTGLSEISNKQNRQPETRIEEAELVETTITKSIEKSLDGLVKDMERKLAKMMETVVEIIENKIKQCVEKMYETVIKDKIEAYWEKKESEQLDKSHRMIQPVVEGIQTRMDEMMLSCISKIGQIQPGRTYDPTKV